MPSFVFIFEEVNSIKKESQFQSSLIKELRSRFDSAIVMKTDPNYIQGIPDVLILYKDKWAALECKRNESASHRPNQDYYVDLMNKMSYSAFIYPENKEDVLRELEESFNLEGMKDL